MGAINPEANVTSGLGNHPYHLGDLQNLSVNDGREGSLYTITSRVTLSPGLNTLFDSDGSAFIVHEFDDKYLPDPPTKDAPGGLSSFGNYLDLELIQVALSDAGANHITDKRGGREA